MEVGFRVKDGVGVRHVNVGVIGFWWTSEGVSASVLVVGKMEAIEAIYRQTLNRKPLHSIQDCWGHGTIVKKREFA